VKESPLKVEGYFFTHVDVRANEKFDPDNAVPIELETDVDFLRNTEDAGQWQVILTVQVDGEKNSNSPYVAQIEVAGLFRHAPVDDDDEDESQLRRIIGASAPAILFSAAREMYMIVASRGPWFPEVWPTVHFRDTIPTPQEKKAAATNGKRKKKAESTSK